MPTFRRIQHIPNRPAVSEKRDPNPAPTWKNKNLGYPSWRHFKGSRGGF